MPNSTPMKPPADRRYFFAAARLAAQRFFSAATIAALPAGITRVQLIFPMVASSDEIWFQFYTCCQASERA